MARDRRSPDQRPIAENARALLRGRGSDCHDFTRASNLQRAQHHAVRYAEHRRIGADANGNRRDRNE